MDRALGVPAEAVVDPQKWWQSVSAIRPGYVRPARGGDGFR